MCVDDRACKLQRRVRSPACVCPSVRAANESIALLARRVGMKMVQLAWLCVCACVSSELHRVVDWSCACVRWSTAVGEGGAVTSAEPTQCM